VVADQTGSPTLADDVAEGIARLLRTDHRGIVHLVNRGAGTRIDMATVIVETLGRAERTSITPIAARDTGAVATRPVYTVLATGLYERLTGHVPRPWREALRDALGAGADA
jgi:dTDP-4-dehydrorhamnose reductase